MPHTTLRVGLHAGVGEEFVVDYKFVEDARRGDFDDAVGHGPENEQVEMATTLAADF